MIKTTPTMNDELMIMQDNLYALKDEIYHNEYAYEGYLDEKLRHLENSVRYFRSIVDEELKNE